MIPNTIYLGDNLATMKTWPDACVHTCVTSPPYFGLRDYGMEGQIGMEETPEAFVARLVEVFREVKRVLRDDGTLWLNLGDSYCNTNGFKRASPQFQREGRNNAPANDRGLEALHATGLKTKDLIGIPWMAAFALRADGWYLRSDIIWHKPNPMPESVFDRPTKAHEYLFLLSKSSSYFFDGESIKEDAVSADCGRESVEQGIFGGKTSGQPQQAFRSILARRNKRTVWSVPVKPFNEAHFATYPTELITPCILAGTSEHGVCDQCAAPYERVVEKGKNPGGINGGEHREPGRDGALGKRERDYEHEKTLGVTRTLGWTATCKCLGGGLAKAVVLDPFMGAGTTALVAATHGRKFVGCELNPAYKEIADKRIAGEVAQEKML